MFCFFVKDLTDLQIELQILKIYFNVFIKNLFLKNLPFLYWSTFGLVPKVSFLFMRILFIFKIIKDYFQ